LGLAKTHRRADKHPEQQRCSQTSGSGSEACDWVMINRQKPQWMRSENQ